MDAETYEQSRTPQPLPSQHLADMAKRISYIAKRYGEIAAAIAEIPDGQLLTTGRPSAERGEKLLLTWLKTLQASLDKHHMGSTADDDASPNLPPGETVVKMVTAPESHEQQPQLPSVKLESSHGKLPFFIGAVIAFRVGRGDDSGRYQI